jgi:hypothetical protein
MNSPKQDAEALLTDILQFAKLMLVQYGAFHPYGGFMRNDGSIVEAGAETPGNDYPAGTTLVELLATDFRNRAKRGEIKAVAIVTDVRVALPGSTVKSDAIQVSVEHRDSYYMDVFFPYRVTADKRVEYGRAFAQAGQKRIFDGSDAS